MGANSKIDWTDHTFNPWWGCCKTSEGCRNCYADGIAHRFGKGEIFGSPRSTSRRLTKTPWKDIVKWDHAAAGRDRARDYPQLIFCMSMGDFFEEHPDVYQWRRDACNILENLSHSVVQMLTKRPENVMRFVPEYWENAWPTHIWMGASVEDQDSLDSRKRRLLSIPAPLHFLSVEPLLGKVDLKLYEFYKRLDGHTSKVDWVIVGGESGPGARECREEWIADVVTQCRKAGVPVFVKQMGGHPNKRDMIEYFPEGLRLRQFPTLVNLYHSRQGE